MATLLLSAAGMAVGGSIGGSVLGLSTAVAGRFIGATLGQLIDQRLMGSGSEVVETGQVDRFRLTGASEGSAIGRIYGRMRVGGQVIWASPFRETVTTTGGSGKGTPEPKTRTYSYTISLAIALCEGPITRVGRIWADGIEISPEDLNMKVYLGTSTQSADPTIAAHKGVNNTPAYRGTAYVVMENLALGQFGNRVPQFSMEVMRGGDDSQTETSDIVTAVAMIPGTGEYSLATTPVHMRAKFGQFQSTNVNSPSGKTDLTTSVEALRDELPNCGAVSLIVSWFGNDLRCGSCSIKPKVEQRAVDGANMPWRVCGVGRSGAGLVPEAGNRPVYGGTPADESVVEAIRHLKKKGQKPMFYPFILMEQLAGNTKMDPYSAQSGQPVLPWRGRITTSLAPSVSGTPDRTAEARAEVSDFFGTAQPSDFSISGDTVNYTGPSEWSYRRFILHYAYLCKAAGGVSAFCIGSEMRGLTQIRDNIGFPAVDALRVLAGEVRSILGSSTKISYASDWSEYFGYQPADGSGDRYFHLDPLWADPAIDFIGIDNYMPLSDWRDNSGHADEEWASVYNLEYLKSNVQGGEGFDWYYADDTARDLQIRTPIEDGSYGEPWVYRYKDIHSWWSQAHYDRIGGARVGASSPWIPQSKPIWFTELGCAAIEKGTNQPNKFIDPKSSESRLPYFSNGQQDDFIQAQYLKAMHGYWGNVQNNPISTQYNGNMVDMSQAYVWAWDARPYPHFPNNRKLWSDGSNYARGHWLNGRATARSLASVVREVVSKCGLLDIDTEHLFGTVRGYQVSDVSSARAALQPLLLVYGIDVIERDGRLIFKSRDGKVKAELDASELVFGEENTTPVDVVRGSDAESISRVRLGFIDSERDYESRAVEAVYPDIANTSGVSQSTFALAMQRNEGVRVAERWLTEARVSRENYQFALPPSQHHLGAGDTVKVDWEGGETFARIDSVEDNGARLVEATRVDTGVYQAPETIEFETENVAFQPIVPVDALFLDLPTITGDEVDFAPHVAVVADPWPGGAAIYSAASENGFLFNTLIQSASIFGELLTELKTAGSGVLHSQLSFDVQLANGELNSVDLQALLSGSNVALLTNGDPNVVEVIQFETADLIDASTYRISGLLRGQAGSDGVAVSEWAVGSYFVLFNAALSQLDLAPVARGIARNYRYGPSSKGYADVAYQEVTHAFENNDLRPYKPCHLRDRTLVDGSLTLEWIRRTRVDGDSWAGLDVPLGEETESYLVTVVKDGNAVRQDVVSQSAWTYDAQDIAAEIVNGAYSVDVSQISALYGAGPAATVQLTV